MVYRIYVEKKEGLSPEADHLLKDMSAFLGLKHLSGVRILNRYDVDNIEKEVFEQAKTVVFSEPQVDTIYEETFPQPKSVHTLLAVEALPGQFDQRADSCSQCVQLMAGVERPLVSYAKIYLLEGKFTDEELQKIKDYLINPVECREATMEKPESLVRTYEEPAPVATVEGFILMGEPALIDLLSDLGLAMDLDDLKFLQKYFRDEEQRDPTITEIRVVDTYWSDHCRHTTFSTHLENINIEDAAVKAAYDRYLAARTEVYGEKTAKHRPKTLMDIATIGTKVLKKRHLLPELDESEEINACSIHVPALVDGHEVDYLLMFKNETHNHPTEIEPFGGAATCIGGCIRDPLSGRAYVHQAMRVTGAGDPRVPFEETTPGKLPQRKLCQTAAAGYSSYGNQIGLATGHVAELYHPGYIAKRLECGAVVGAAPASHVRREVPAPGDKVILLGGRTGRDGIGGATGSSKSHNMKSLTTMASEVQKGNAPEERKIQRLFRRSDVTRLIKRCNDFGAGGVSVAIGELADGLKINLDAVRKKYDGLDGTELAISESQERMAVVVAPQDVKALLEAARSENLEAYEVAEITEEARMVMTFKGQTIANLSRRFLNTNGAVKHADVTIPSVSRNLRDPSFHDLRSMAGSLRCASRQGLIERFDSTIGAGSILMPFGGKTQRSPSQAMAALLPVEPDQKTSQGSVMAYACDPEWMMVDPYTGAQVSVINSISKIVAAGASWKKVYLTLQEYFEKLRNEPLRWGKPMKALLGALDAQLGLNAAAIGGKDSMSGSFLDFDVPPTLISFAIAPIKAQNVITTPFKAAGSNVYLVSGGRLDNYELHKKAWDEYHRLCVQKRVKAAWAVDSCIAEGLMNMSFGNEIGFEAEISIPWYLPNVGAILVEVEGEWDSQLAIRIGHTTEKKEIKLRSDSATIEELRQINDSVLANVYPTKTEEKAKKIKAVTYDKGTPAVCRHKTASPKVVIPVFPGTNCEYDSARACLTAGMEAEIVVVRNLTPQDLAESAKALETAIKSANVMFIPGGFSGGDEPDGSAKFIASFLRNPYLTDAIHDLLKNRDGLMLGICNGFQALIKLGLVPYGEIVKTDDTCPTLTYNTIGRHQSSIVHTRVCTNNSPWLMDAKVGETYTVPISHGEGRFLASEALLKELAEKGQIATQYVDLSGNPTMETAFNPNGSLWAVEGIVSPDGRVLGKMGHSERVGDALYRNMPGNYDLGLFTSAVKYFK